MHGPQNVKYVATLQDRNLIFLKRVSENSIPIIVPPSTRQGCHG